MPRPRSLTREDIAVAALTVVDRDGVSGLSMRAVASELGTSAMALYRYVDDREQLEHWIVDHVLAAVDLSLPTPASWQQQIVALLERSRRAVTAHPGVVPLLLVHRHASTASLRLIEAMLAVLAEAGFSGERRVVAQRSLIKYLLGSLQVEHLGPLTGRGTHAMAELSVTEFPYVVETARVARQLTSDEEFRAGLAALLRGLSS